MTGPAFAGVGTPSPGSGLKSQKSEASTDEATDPDPRMGAWKVLGVFCIPSDTSRTLGLRLVGEERGEGGLMRPFTVCRPLVTSSLQSVSSFSSVTL